MPAVKIITVGNSLGIVLPREVLQRLRVAKGSLLHLVDTLDGVELLPYQPSFAVQVEMLETTVRADRDVLRGLSLRTAAGGAGSAAPLGKPGRTGSDG